MSLPPGFLDELRNRSSIVQVVGRKVIWDARKSNQGKGDMWAPCPFHHEKTASFHVDDRKGYYYCFGCHAKGDALGFVKETENVTFMEAVEILAREVGMQMPARDPQAQQKADRRTQLTDVMEHAVRFFRLQLQTGQGAQAVTYLDTRGLDVPTKDQFEIGFAPAGWQNLWDHLKDKGIADDLIFGAGLAKPSTKGGKPYDTFRNRIMFPIRDPQGRAIAFGGRAMDPDDNAKYLNSPETDLFDKGRSLYNYGPARKAVGQNQPLIVAEGYMDVIALARAGFEASVAPLGTAITETQLQLLWRVGPEPVIALDGDVAGLRAAMRVIDLALPLLAPGQSLRFAVMPSGMDPDDLLKSQGADAMRQLIDTALPMVRMLWNREIEGKDFDSPERRAALDHSLRQLTFKIEDQTIRRYYETALKDFKWQLFRPQGASKKAPFKSWPPKPNAGGAAMSTKNSFLATNTDRSVETLNEAAILAVALTHPSIIAQFESQLERLEFQTATHQKILLAILRSHDTQNHDAQGHDPQILTQLTANVAQIVGAAALEDVMNRPHIQTLPAIRAAQDTDLAVSTMAEQLAKLEAGRGHRIEIDEAQNEIDVADTERTTWRVSKATDALHEAGRKTFGDSDDDGENTGELSRHLQSLIDNEVWLKKRK